MVPSRQDEQDNPILTVGRYVLFNEIARGGMATVHLGRMSSLGGFSRTVAVKRMKREIATDPEFVAMFLDEARLTARIEHPNVVATLDVVAEAGELFLVMEYVRGESLYRLLRSAAKLGEPVPIAIGVSIVAGALAGLHAAHEAVGEGGAPLGIVHRDVSPQNILVGEDGVPRITDFGIAKAESRLQVTREGQMKGKLCYMAPEQFSRAGRSLDRRIDIFSAATVLWELLSGQRLFQGDHPAETMANVLNAPIPALVSVRADVPHALDALVRRALSRDPEQRPRTAEQFAIALEDAMGGALASSRAIGAWVSRLAGPSLETRHQYIREIESQNNAALTPISQVLPSTPRRQDELRPDAEGQPGHTSDLLPALPVLPLESEPPGPLPQLPPPQAPPLAWATRNSVPQPAPMMPVEVQQVAPPLPQLDVVAKPVNEVNGEELPVAPKRPLVLIAMAVGGIAALLTIAIFLIARRGDSPAASPPSTVVTGSPAAASLAAPSDSPSNASAAAPTPPPPPSASPSPSTQSPAKPPVPGPLKLPRKDPVSNYLPDRP